MRILYFADIRFPLERANGIQTMQTCHALCERGHVVRLVVRPDTAGTARNPFDFYGLPFAPGLTLERIASDGSPVRRRLRYLVAALRRTVRPTSADVVVTRDLGVASLLLRLPRSRRLPILYESHGYAPVVSGQLPALLSNASPASGRKTRRLAARERRVWRQVEGYVTITAALRAEMSGRFGPRPRTAVIPDGVRLADQRAFVPPRDCPAPVVAYAGHLYPWKGVTVLLEALAEFTEASGLIVGGHPKEADLEAMRRQAAALGIEARVRFTGAVAPAAVQGLLETADILVLPNTATPISARYSSPLKLFEYLAAGKPIVASDLASIREVVEDGRNALVAAPGDARAFAAALRRLAGDRGLAERLARQAFDDACQYTWERRAERLESLLLDCVS